MNSGKNKNMDTIYQVTVHGRKLESRDLKRLLARAVAEKRIMDQRLRLFGAGGDARFTGSAFPNAVNLCCADVVGR